MAPLVSKIVCRYRKKCFQLKNGRVLSSFRSWLILSLPLLLLTISRPNLTKQPLFRTSCTHWTACRSSGFVGCAATQQSTPSTTTPPSPRPWRTTRRSVPSSRVFTRRSTACRFTRFKRTGSRVVEPWPWNQSN